MLDIASHRRPATDMPTLLTANTNDDTSPPAAAHALFLDAVTYPRELYLEDA
jgi:tRNA U38,U39,U40 pseudouridine synthase TruA